MFSSLAFQELGPQPELFCSNRLPGGSMVQGAAGLSIHSGKYEWT